MRCCVVAFIALIAFPALSQPAPPPTAELDEVARLGQALYAYDRAAARASAAVLDHVHGEEGISRDEVSGYVAVPEDDGWRVGFGALSPDGEAFLVKIEVLLGPDAASPEIVVFDEEEVRTGPLLDGARAITAAANRFTFREPAYNFSLVPAADGHVYVYVIPAQVRPGLYPLGGDVRYRFDPEARAIVEEKALHSSFQLMASEIDGEYVRGTMSPASDAGLPVETDVLLAMVRRPQIPHYVVSGEWVYKITPDGTIEPIPADQFGDDELIEE